MIKCWSPRRPSTQNLIKINPKYCTYEHTDIQKGFTRQTYSLKHKTYEINQNGQTKGKEEDWTWT